MSLEHISVVSQGQPRPAEDREDSQPLLTSSFRVSAVGALAGKALPLWQKARGKSERDSAPAAAQSSARGTAGSAVRSTGGSSSAWVGPGRGHRRCPPPGRAGSAAGSSGSAPGPEQLPEAAPGGGSAGDGGRQAGRQAGRRAGRAGRLRLLRRRHVHCCRRSAAATGLHRRHPQPGGRAGDRRLQQQQGLEAALLLAGECGRRAEGCPGGERCGSGGTPVLAAGALGKGKGLRGRLRAAR